MCNTKSGKKIVNLSDLNTLVSEECLNKLIFRVNDWDDHKKIRSLGMLCVDALTNHFASEEEMHLLQEFLSKHNFFCTSSKAIVGKYVGLRAKGEISEWQILSKASVALLFGDESVPLKHLNKVLPKGLATDLVYTVASVSSPSEIDQCVAVKLALKKNLRYIHTKQLHTVNGHLDTLYKVCNTDIKVGHDVVLEKDEQKKFILRIVENSDIEKLIKSRLTALRS